MASQKKTRILILGGGFAGLHAAIHLDDTLARDPDVEITLVNRDNFFLFTPMLHEVAASDLDLTNIVNPIRKLLGRINFFAGEVESINLERKIVTVSHGFDHHHHDIPYDHVVIGLGSITNFFNLPGLEQRAMTMKSLGDAIHLRNRLIAHLEEADTECCADIRRPLLNFVVAGASFPALRQSFASLWTGLLIFSLAKIWCSSRPSAPRLSHTWMMRKRWQARVHRLRLVLLLRLSHDALRRGCSPPSRFRAAAAVTGAVA